MWIELEGAFICFYHNVIFYILEAFQCVNGEPVVVVCSGESGSVMFVWDGMGWVPLGGFITKD